MTENLKIKCNDFKENTVAAFQSLSADKDFADVTLVCEDGHQVGAHKVILAASSPFFQNLLKRNQHPHPLIFMRNVSSENLEAIIDFLYHGEANLLEQNLESFLVIADELMLKGLSGEKDQEINKGALTSKPKIILDNIKEEMDIGDSNTNTLKEEHVDGYDYESIDPISELPRSDEGIESMMGKSLNMISNGKDKQIYKLICNVCGKEGRRAVIKQHIIANHLETSANNQALKKEQEHKERVYSLMGKTKNLVPNAKDSNGKEKKIYYKICKLCGKEGQFTNIRNHIESSHLEDVQLPCNSCGKTFATRYAMKTHNRKCNTTNEDCGKQLEHKERVKLMMGKTDTLVPNGKHSNGKEKMIYTNICKLCGKEGRFTKIRDHIETSHLENMQIPCTNCGKTFTSTSAMKLHNRRSHTKNI